MRSARFGRAVFVVAFVILVLDGAAAVWLGQITDRAALVVVGLLLCAGALGLATWYRRWRVALEEIEAARRDLQAEIGALRRAALDARDDRWRSS